jgi:hypothetical protein
MPNPITSRLLRGKPFDGLTIATSADNTSTFDPSWAFSDASVMTVDWGDGTPIQSHATGLSHTYAGVGIKYVKFTCPDWTKLTAFDINTDVCRLVLPSFAACTTLNDVRFNSNQFAGTLPSFATCTGLDVWIGYDNLFSGTLPSFAGLSSMYVWYGFANQFSGILPSFATCTALIEFQGQTNQFSGYTAGGFATQARMTLLRLQTNNLPEASIDAILVDCVTSLALPGRVVCNLNLGGVGNAAPSNPAGLASKATLVAAGWTMTTN